MLTQHLGEMARKRNRLIAFSAESKDPESDLACSVSRTLKFLGCIWEKMKTTVRL